MAHSWNETRLKSVDEVLAVLEALQAKPWLSRGQPECYPELKPKIDRGDLAKLSRREKLVRERESIDVFRSTAHFFAGPGEEHALVDDIVALMVLRHYGAPTRLLDWTGSPYVAAYFAVCSGDTKDGEIWTFDRPLYEQNGKEQWTRNRETTIDGSGDPGKFDAKLTAFAQSEPDHWFIVAFYPVGFPRQNAQRGAYSMTPGFGRCHAEAIGHLLGDGSRHHRYVIEASLKPNLRRILRETHGLWRGSLFPDSAGAAETASAVFST